ncbi:MAG: acyltransferase [Acidimicrobiales bacterium]
MTTAGEVEDAAPAPEPAPPAPTRYLDFEAYRGLAAVLVVIFHAYQFAGTDPYLYGGRPADRVLHQLDGTVAWFFVLSGFLIFLPVAGAALGQAPVPTARGFLVRRAVRILPLYWTAILVAWALRNGSLPGDWRDLVEHLTFTQLYDQKRIFYTIGASWSLAVEITFYLAVALLIPLVVPRLRVLSSRAAQLAGLLALCAVVIAGSAAWKILEFSIHHVPKDNFPAYFNPLARADTFAFGMALAVVVAACSGRPVLPRGAGIGLRVAAGAVWVWAVVMRPAGNNDNPWFHTLSGLGMALLLASSVLGARGARWERALGARPFTFLATVSYSLYLWHEPILTEFSTRGWLFTHPEDFVRNALALMGVSLVVAWLSYRLIERPTSSLRHLFTPEGRFRDYYADVPDR